jgi:hypothetical protein
MQSVDRAPGNRAAIHSVTRRRLLLNQSCLRGVRAVHDSENTSACLKANSIPESAFHGRPFERWPCDASESIVSDRASES